MVQQRSNNSTVWLHFPASTIGHNPMVQTRTARLLDDESRENDNSALTSESEADEQEENNEDQDEDNDMIVLSNIIPNPPPKEFMDLVGGPIKFGELMNCVQSYTHSQSNFEIFQNSFSSEIEKDKLIGLLMENVYFFRSFLAGKPMKNSTKGQNMLFIQYAVQKFGRKHDKVDLPKLL